MKNIENGYTRSSSTRRLRPRKIPITGYSRGGKGNSLLLSRYSPSSRRSLRSIDRSLRLFFESNHSRNNRKRRIGQDRVGKRTLPPTIPLHPSRQLLVVPSARPFSSTEYRFVGHYRELPMENVIDSACPKRHTEILWKSLGEGGYRLDREGVVTRSFT